MGSVCISSAAILRCSSCLSRTQNIVLFVPAALEFLSATGLLYFKWRSGRTHLLLTAEGWIYFSLALLELLSVTPPLYQSTFRRFRAIDIGIGIASILPLFLYTWFLYLFTSSDLLTTLPTYIRKVAKVALFCSLPLIIATNEVASVVGLQFTFDSSGALSSFAFSTKHDEWFWLLFTSLTLAILTAFQATVFSFSFFRLIWILVQRGRDNGDFKLQGVPWVSAGVKLGVLETVVGFAGGGFEISLIRRIMRFLGRACLCIGVIKGVVAPDTNSSSYNNLEKDEQKRIQLSKLRSSRMNIMISNPRLSTFQELTPTAGTFHSAPRAAKTRSPGIKVPHYRTYSQRHPLSNVQFLGIPDTSQFASATTNNQRVTVLYDDHGGPPLLHMRFSNLDVPSPSLLANGAQIRPASTYLSPEVDVSQADGAPLSCPPGQLFSSAPFELDLDDDDLTMPKRPFAHERKTSGSSGVSTSSVASVVEIISVPRRTISQRRAEARVFRANSVKARVEFEKDSCGGPAIDTTNGKDITSTLPWGEQMRPSSAGTFGTSGANLIEAHTRTESQSTSIRSATDSIQAVQELARQFPCLPAPVSAVDTEFEASEGSCETIRCPSGVFSHAIGSPTELRDAHTRSGLRSFAAVHDSLDGTSSFVARQLPTDTFLPSQLTAAGSIPQTRHPLYPQPTGPIPPPIPWIFAATPASSLLRQSDGFQVPLSRHDPNYRHQSLSLNTRPTSFSCSDDPQYWRNLEGGADDLSVLSFPEPQRNTEGSRRGSTISTSTDSLGKEQVTPRVQPIVISPETPDQAQAFQTEAVERVKSRG